MRQLPHLSGHSGHSGHQGIVIYPVEEPVKIDVYNDSVKRPLQVGQ
ncbi:hypothetical protein BH23ACT12_BH23ACT12_17440 [soil metagenome]